MKFVETESPKGYMNADAVKLFRIYSHAKEWIVEAVVDYRTSYDVSIHPTENDALFALQAIIGALGK